jgi:hypothetical protein
MISKDLTLNQSGLLKLEKDILEQGTTHSLGLELKLIKTIGHKNIKGVEMGIL